MGMTGKCRIIGITGGIGSGKSVVSRILRLNGCFVYDCDLEARVIMEREESVSSAIKSLLGEEAYLPDGCVDRAFVASVVFADSDKLNGLNSIVHKAVRDDFLQRVKWLSCQEIPAPLRRDVIFCESAILSTAHMDAICDEIWLVTAPETLRIERVIRRNGLTEREIMGRMEAQKREFDSLPSEKVTLIDNDRSTPILRKILRLIDNNRNIIEQTCLEKY